MSENEQPNNEEGAEKKNPRPVVSPFKNDDSGVDMAMWEHFNSKREVPFLKGKIGGEMVFGNLSNHFKNADQLSEGYPNIVFMDNDGNQKAAGWVNEDKNGNPYLSVKTADDQWVNATLFTSSMSEQLANEVRAMATPKPSTNKEVDTPAADGGEPAPEPEKEQEDQAPAGPAL